MACTLTGSIEGDARLFAEDRAEAKQLELTQLLCKVCKHLDAMGVKPRDADVREWWGTHKKQDEAAG